MKISSVFKCKLSVLSGTFFEFYEFTLYGVFSSYFSLLFFPKNQNFLALSFSLIVFAIGSVAKPIGGIFFGFVGDTLGRRKALCISMLMMVLPTFVIGVLPSYSDMGICSSLMLVFCRFFQGLSAGGEFNGASIYMVEYSNPKSQGINGAMTVTVSAIGTLMAMLLGSLVLRYERWWFNWRLLFIVGALGGTAIFIIRNTMKETPGFQHAAEKSSLCLTKYNLIKLLGVVGIGCFGSVSGFTLFTYLNIYLHEVIRITLSESMLLSSLGIFLFIVLNPIFGYLANRFDPANMMCFSCMMTFFLSTTIYDLLSRGTTANILIAEVAIAICAALFTGPMNYFLVTLFPIKMRYRFISFGYSLGIAVFGGTMPLICTTLIQKTENIKIPALYLMMSALIGFFSVLTLSAYKNKSSSVNSDFHTFQRI